MPCDSTPPRPCRVLVVEDHPLVRLGLTATIGRDPRLEVCGETDNTADAWRLIEDSEPDVAVVDLVLKSGAGLDLIRRIAAHRPSLRVVVSSMQDPGVYADRVRNAGASAFVPKCADIDRLLAELLQDDPEPSRRLLPEAECPLPEQDATHALTDRELEVFRQIGEGLTTREIAGRLHRSVKTVESFKARIKRKLDLNNAAELAHRAARWTSAA